MAKSYYGMKDVKLKELAEERKLEIAKETPFPRARVCEELIKWDMENGKADEALMENDDGEFAPVEVDPKYKMVTVIFHETREDENDYVFVGHNGRSAYIPKQKEIRVPQYILDSCINDAVIHIEEPIPEGNKIVYKKRSIKRFPYTVVTN